MYLFYIEIFRLKKHLIGVFLVNVVFLILFKILTKETNLI